MNLTKLLKCFGSLIFQLELYLNFEHNLLKLMETGPAIIRFQTVMAVLYLKFIEVLQFIELIKLMVIEIKLFLKFIKFLKVKQFLRFILAMRFAKIIMVIQFHMLKFIRLQVNFAVV